jgi:hypothetical protein
MNDNKKKPGLKKGATNNPKGRPALPDDVNAMRRMSKEDVIRAYWKYATCPTDNIPKPETLVEKGICKLVEDFADDGEIYSMSQLWDRVMGKAEAPIDITSGGEAIQISFTRDK